MHVHPSTKRAAVARKLNTIKIKEIKLTKGCVGGFRTEMVISTIQIG